MNNRIFNFCLFLLLIGFNNSLHSQKLISLEAGATLNSFDESSQVKFFENNITMPLSLGIMYPISKNLRINHEIGIQNNKITGDFNLVDNNAVLREVDDIKYSSFGFNTTVRYKIPLKEDKYNFYIGIGADFQCNFSKYEKGSSESEFEDILVFLNIERTNWSPLIECIFYTKISDNLSLSINPSLQYTIKKYTSSYSLETVNNIKTSLSIGLNYLLNNSVLNE